MENTEQRKTINASIHAFPIALGPVNRNPAKQLFVHVHCICQLPEYYYYIGIVATAIRAWLISFALDTSFHIGMSILIVTFTVCMGCLFSQRDAHIHCENGHPDAYSYVNIGIGMPIFTWKWASGMPIFGDAHIHLTPLQQSWRSCYLWEHSIMPDMAHGGLWLI